MVKVCQRNIMRNKIFDLGTINMNWERVCLKEASSKVSFLVWVAARGRVLTLDNLKIKGSSLVGRCSFCKCHDEDMLHSSLPCPFALSLWDHFLGYCINERWSITQSGI